MIIEDFDDIWSRFEWVIQDMNEGMSLFEGYIPAITQADLLPALLDLTRRMSDFSFAASVWADDASESERIMAHTPSDCVELFRSRKIVCLHCDYEVALNNVALAFKLIFEPNDEATSLEIICYRDAILRSDDPKTAVHIAIDEFRNLNARFGGNALFIGPDTVEYPSIEPEHHGAWLRIA